MIFLKLLMLVVTAGLFWQLFELWRAGRQLVRIRNPRTLAAHRSKVSCVGCLTLIAVVIVETQVRLSSQPYQSSTLLFIFHLIVVGLLVATFVTIVVRFTGLKNPYWHRRFVYTFYSLFLMATASGGVLLYQLPE